MTRVVISMLVLLNYFAVLKDRDLTDTSFFVTNYSEPTSFLANANSVSISETI